MAKKAKVGGRNKVVEKAAPRLFVIRREGAMFGAYCMTTGRLISLRETAYDARKRAGKKGWSESEADQGA